MRDQWTNRKKVVLDPRPSDRPLTWISVDAPGSGSMGILHETGCTPEEANRRTTLATAAPVLLEALKEVLADVDRMGDVTYATMEAIDAAIKAAEPKEEA